MTKTSTKRKAISQKEVVEKKKALRDSVEQQITRQTHELLALWPAKKYLEDEIEVPDVSEWYKGYHVGTKETSTVNKITWVLTVVNVAILISLVIKNV